MFWWLSFIRPPPISCDTGEIDFIIQISNDLRTELYPEAIDVYYHWISADRDTITPATKLTTWRPENTHKLLTIAGPLRQQNNIRTVIPATGVAAPHHVTWRLGLFTLNHRSLSHPDASIHSPDGHVYGRRGDPSFSPSSSSSSTSTSERLALVDLGSGELLSRVLPLYSAPILFQSSSGGSLRKGANGQAHSKRPNRSPNINKATAGTDKKNNNKSNGPIKKQDEIHRIFSLPISRPIQPPLPLPCDQRKDQLDPLSRAVAHPLSASPKLLGLATEGAREELSITEKTSFDLDKKLWDSAIGLGSWLSQRLTGLSYDSASPGVVERHDNQSDHGMEEQEEEEERALMFTLTSPGCRILELGALLSRAASTGPALQIDNGRVAVARLHATDLESAVPLIERNIRSNIHLFCDRVQSGPNPDQFRAAGTDDAEGAGLELESSSTTQPHLKPRSIQISAGVLDWEDDRLPQEVQDAPPNVIMMSDVTYNTSSFPALIQTLKRLVDISPQAWVILAYKERHAAERTAWSMFENEVNLRLKKVEEVKGAGGAPVEIWIGQSLLYTNSQ